MPALSINMLGRTTINYNGEHIESKISTKAMAMICYLISNLNKKISREKLAGYLWADSDEESARYNLRFCLWSIKRIIHQDARGEEFIICEKELCYVNERYDLFCDILYLKENEKEEDPTLEQLLKLKSFYSGDFLEGLYVNKSPEFNDFVLFERIVYQNKNVELLKRIFGKYKELERHTDCIIILKEMLGIDTYNEEFVLLLMEAYCKANNFNEGIKYYQKFEKSLRKNLNVSLSRKLKDFHDTMILAKLEEKELSNKSISEAKSHSGKKDQVIRNQGITVDTFCLREIPFFWISDTIGKLVQKMGDEKSVYMENSYIGDLASIQNKILQLSEEKIDIPDFVPPVRIINAFCELLKGISSQRTVLIIIDNIDNIDPLSKDALQYIENISMEGIEIIKKRLDYPNRISSSSL